MLKQFLRSKDMTSVQNRGKKYISKSKNQRKLAQDHMTMKNRKSFLASFI